MKFQPRKPYSERELQSFIAVRQRIWYIRPGYARSLETRDDEILAICADTLPWGEKKKIRGG